MSEKLGELLLEFEDWALFDGKYSQSTIIRDVRKIKELSAKMNVVSPNIEDVRSYFLDKIRSGAKRQTLNVTRKAFLVTLSVCLLAPDLILSRKYERTSSILGETTFILADNSLIFLTSLMIVLCEYFPSKRAQSSNSRSSSPSFSLMVLPPAILAQTRPFRRHIHNHGSLIRCIIL